MKTDVLLISTGLVFDIIGVVLIFFFGIAPLIDNKGAIIRVTGEIDEKEKQKVQCYKSISRIGLILIIIGFLCQLIGNFIEN